MTKPMWVLVARGMISMDLLGVIGPFDTKREATKWMMKYTQHKTHIITPILVNSPIKTVKENKLDK